MIQKEESRILRQLKNGTNASCIKINLSDPRIIEICGISGVDAVWFCGEHVANDWLNLENQIRAAALYDMDALVRVPKGSYSDYIKPLEAGARGIIVPNVKTPEEAKEIITMTRFRPTGNRALDGGNRDGHFARISTEDYIARSNRNQLLVFQIESPEGLENVEAIAALEGFDFLFFGPGDYAHQIGLPGQIHDPRVKEARERVIDVATQYGKMVISTGVSPEDFPDGPHQVFIVGADVVGLGNYFNEALLQFQNDSPITPSSHPY